MSADEKKNGHVGYDSSIRNSTFLPEVVHSGLEVNHDESGLQVKQDHAGTAPELRYGEAPLMIDENQTAYPHYQSTQGYQDSAPGYTRSPVGQYDPNRSPNEQTPKRAKRTIWILVGIIALLVVVGAVLGGVLGTQLNKKKR